MMGDRLVQSGKAVLSRRWSQAGMIGARGGAARTVPQSGLLGPVTVVLSSDR